MLRLLSSEDVTSPSFAFTAADLALTFSPLLGGTLRLGLRLCAAALACTREAAL